MPSDLELSIIRTVAYFSHFSYPLTKFEVWKWLLMPAEGYSLAQVYQAFSTSEILSSSLTTSGGFVGLGNVEAQIADRRSRLQDALRKYAKLERYLKLFSRVPYIEGIAVCNSLAFHHTTAASDIDLFLVTKPGRTWSARLWTTAPLMFMRQRPGETDNDPICLSFFASVEALNLESVKIAEEDPYLAYWTQTLIPLVDRSGRFRDFSEINVWARKILPNAEGVRRAPSFRIRSRRALPPTPVKEAMARKLQEDRFSLRLRAMMNHDSRVVINDRMLKFHDDDRRAEIAAALKEKMATLV